ncbi:MAG TPA: hypothetical protein VIB48_03820 [Acidimicrobiia bacterium]
MVPTREPGPGDRPIDRARAAIDRGARGLKAWWRSVDAPAPPVDAVDLTADDGNLSRAVELAAPVDDDFRAQVTEELARLRREVGARDAELLHALQRLATSFERVAERMESDARERQLLSEAVLRLERRLPPADHEAGPVGELPKGERVIGGRVTPAAPKRDPESREVDLPFTAIKAIKPSQVQL